MQQMRKGGRHAQSRISGLSGTLPHTAGSGRIIGEVGLPAASYCTPARVGRAVPSVEGPTDHDRLALRLTPFLPEAAADPARIRSPQSWLNGRVGVDGWSEAGGPPRWSGGRAVSSTER